MITPGNKWILHPLKYQHFTYFVKSRKIKKRQFSTTFWTSEGTRFEIPRYVVPQKAVAISK